MIDPVIIPRTDNRVPILTINCIVVKSGLSKWKDEASSWTTWTKSRTKAKISTKTEQCSGTKVLNKYKMTAERGEIEQAKKNFFRQENAQVMSIKQSLRRNGKKGTKKEK